MKKSVRIIFMWFVIVLQYNCNQDTGCILMYEEDISTSNYAGSIHDFRDSLASILYVASSEISDYNWNVLINDLVYKADHIPELKAILKYLIDQMIGSQRIAIVVNPNDPFFSSNSEEEIMWANGIITLKYKDALISEFIFHEMFHQLQYLRYGSGYMQDHCMRNVEFEAYLLQDLCVMMSALRSGLSNLDSKYLAYLKENNFDRYTPEEIEQYKIFLRDVCLRNISREDFIQKADQFALNFKAYIHTDYAAGCSYSLVLHFWSLICFKTLEYEKMDIFSDGILYREYSFSPRICS